MNIKRMLITAASALTMIFGVSAVTVHAAPVTMPDGGLFDAQFYAAAYPDVMAAFGTDPDLLYMHYTLAGKAEGRLPYDPAYAAVVPAAPAAGTDNFDVNYYATKYPDVAAILGYDPALLKLHYDLYGKAEGRFANAAEEAAANAAAAAAANPGGQIIYNDTLPLTGLALSNLGSRYAAIEADLTLSGTGTGYHAKILLQSGVSQSAVSFGIQYDLFGARPYNGRSVYLCENIIHNGPGGQAYTRHGDALLGVPQRVMMILDTQTGIVYLYVNGNQVGQVGNTNLLAGNLCVSVEGCARLDGDSVNAMISNIRFKKPGTSGTNGDPAFLYTAVSRNPGISVGYTNSAMNSHCTNPTVNITGTIVGLNGLDWDSAYASVSGVVGYAYWI